MHSKLSAPVFKSADGERSATWLELFFDLVFVVSVAALSYRLEHHFTREGVLLLFVYFLPIWWCWMEYSYYGDLFDDDSVSYQFLMLTGMAGVMYMSLVIRSDGLAGSRLYELTYIFMGGVALLMYLRAYLMYPDLRWFTRRFMGTIALSIGCFALSLWFEPPWRYLLWVLGIAIQAAASPSIYLFRRDYPVQLSHMPERFGLFSIIVLGEGIVALTAASQAEQFSYDVAVYVLGGFALTVCIWKLYFYEASKDTITEQLKENTRRSTLMSFFYGYSHYFLYISVMLISVSILILIESSIAEHPHPPLAVYLLHGACVLFLTAITLIHWAAPESLFRSVVLARIGCVVASAILLVTELPAIGEVYAQVGVLSCLIVAEYLIYRSHGVTPEQGEEQMTEAA